MKINASRLAATTLLGVSAVASYGATEIDVAPEIAAKRIDLASRLDALATATDSLSAPIRNNRVAQWNNWNNLWDNIAWLKWKNF